MSSQATTSRRWGARSIAALLIFILATALTPVALVGHWGHRTVLDSERYIDTVGPLVASPVVQESLTAAVTDAVIAQVDTTNQVQGLLTSLFPDAKFTDQLASPIAAGINSMIGQLVGKFIASDAFEKVWIQLNTTAQKSLVRLLEGGQEGPVQLVGDNVVLDVSSALGAIQTYLVDNGVSAAANLTVPQTDRQIVLMNAPALSQIRFVYSLTSPLLQWFPLLIAALFALSIALARRRARTVVATGVVLVVSAAALALGLNAAEAAFVNQLDGTIFGPASTVFWSTMFAYLVLGIQAIAVFGVIVIVAGWFGGTTTSATGLRTRVKAGLADINSRLPAGPKPLCAFVRGNIANIRWGIYLVMGLVLLLGDVLSMAHVLWTVALTAGLITVTQLRASSVPAEAGTTTISTPDSAPSTNA